MHISDTTTFSNSANSAKKGKSKRNYEVIVDSNEVVPRFVDASQENNDPNAARPQKSPAKPPKKCTRKESNGSNDNKDSDGSNLDDVEIGRILKNRFDSDGDGETTPITCTVASDMLRFQNGANITITDTRFVRSTRGDTYTFAASQLGEFVCVIWDVNDANGGRVVYQVASSQRCGKYR